MNSMNITIEDNSITLTLPKAGRIYFSKKEYASHDIPMFDITFYPEGDRPEGYPIMGVYPDGAFTLLKELTEGECKTPLELLKCWLELRQQGYKPITK